MTFSWTRAAAALQVALLHQRAALVLALAALRAPLVGPPKAVSLGAAARWAAVSWPRVQQHPLVRLALRVRAARLAAISRAGNPPSR